MGLAAKYFWANETIINHGEFMKTPTNTPTSQDYDRKHGEDHIANNPRAIKDIPGREPMRVMLR